MILTFSLISSYCTYNGQFTHFHIDLLTMNLTLTVATKNQNLAHLTPPHKGEHMAKLHQNPSMHVEVFLRQIFPNFDLETLYEWK
jgi:hypothetical protein